MKHRKVQVTLIAMRQNKYYLLLLQTLNKNGGFWQNVTGSVDEGESFKEGALRELFEETGIKKSQLEKFEKLDYEIEFTDKWKREVLEKAYVGLINDTMEIVMCPKEHQAYKWVECSEVMEDDFKYLGNFEVFKLGWSKIV